VLVVRGGGWMVTGRGSRLGRRERGVGGLVGRNVGGNEGR